MSLLDYHFLIFPPPCIQTYHILFPTLLVYLTLLNLLFHPIHLFGPIFYEIEYPPYSFIWPYSFDWHLRVDDGFATNSIQFQTKKYQQSSLS